MRNRQLKAELAESKAENTKLEEQIKKLHHLRIELDIIHEVEKTRLLKQWEQYRKTSRLIIKRKHKHIQTSSSPTYLSQGVHKIQGD
jgi:hypothetical protein